MTRPLIFLIHLKVIGASNKKIIEALNPKYLNASLCGFK